MNFLHELLKRRVPQILGSYVVAGTSQAMFIEWLITRYAFPPHFLERECGKGEFSSTLGIDIQIIDIYDSTASAIIYKKRTPYITLKKGDKLHF